MNRRDSQKTVSLSERQRGAGAARVYVSLALGTLVSAGCAVGPDDPEAASDALLELGFIDAAVAAGDGGSAPLPRSSEGDAGGSTPAISIDGVTFMGNCGGARPVISPDGTTVSLQFDDFEASVQAGVGAMSCSAWVFVRAPAGFAYKLESLSGAGTVALPEGALASFGVDYRSESDGVTTHLASTQFKGPLNGPVTFQHEFPTYEHQCRGRGNIDVSASIFLSNVASAVKPASMSLRSIDLARFTLKPCIAR